MKFPHAAAGAASVFDLNTQLRQPHVLYQRLGLPPHITDALSLAKDWRKVGEDLEAAILACAEVSTENPALLEPDHEQSGQLELFSPESRAPLNQEELQRNVERLKEALIELLEEADAAAYSQVCFSTQTEHSTGKQRR